MCQSELESIQVAQSSANPNVHAKQDVEKEWNWKIWIITF